VRSCFGSKAEQLYSEQQVPSPQQPVHLMMAGYAEAYSDGKEKSRRKY
jgi:hypothetical protein